MSPLRSILVGIVFGILVVAAVTYHDLTDPIARADIEGLIAEPWTRDFYKLLAVEFALVSIPTSGLLMFIGFVRRPGD
ncbi:hypothetical protein [Parerythrobacter lacustris]|uniref:Uncharacterized protein n=1 Tax=Parerythrobacter lacustris TaxID=2969984 RepID=A0ABT1XTL9_9SPHN|nr:hypothetical protein [Parerythrobacter lacustris]MCR2834966.1 hypothetical protein [Parerythrobacter lacustris]